VEDEVGSGSAWRTKCIVALNISVPQFILAIDSSVLRSVEDCCPGVASCVPTLLMLMLLMLTLVWQALADFLG